MRRQAILRLLFSPAVQLMHRLPYAYKFAVNGLLAMAAILYLFYALTSHLQGGIASARQEQFGLAMDRPLLALVQQVQQHRRLSVAVLGGEDSLLAARADKEAQVQRAIEAVDLAAAEHGVKLNVVASWQAIKGHWQSLHTSGLQMSASVNLAAHSALIEELLLLVSKISGSSQLVRDPDGNSAFVVATATSKLPRTLESLGLLRAKGIWPLTKKALDDAGRASFAAEVAVLRAGLAELDTLLSQIEASSPRVAVRIRSFAAGFHGATAEVVQIVSNDLVAARFSTSPERYVEKTTEAIDLGFQFEQELLLPLLETLLAARIERMQQAYFRSAALATVFMLLFSYLAAGAYLAVMSSIEALRTGANRMADGDLITPIVLQTRDELCQVAASFNHMAAQLAQRTDQLLKHTDELKTLNRKLEALSASDGLTGIANRRCFDQVLASEWVRAARLGQPLALAMLDIDWFKAYNDHYGHQAGDECLRRVAELFAASVCRTGDLVARYGGEEFAFIAPATDGVGALDIAERVCAALQAQALPHARSDFGCVTASIGVAVMVPSEDSTPDVLVRAADEALYRAKEQGRNRVVMA